MREIGSVFFLFFLVLLLVGRGLKLLLLLVCVWGLVGLGVFVDFYAGGF